MSYHFMGMSVTGALISDALPFDTIADAMRSARHSLSSLADAWIEDDDGRRVAGFLQIEEYCRTVTDASFLGS